MGSFVSIKEDDSGKVDGGNGDAAHSVRQGRGHNCTIFVGAALPTIGSGNGICERKGAFTAIGVVCGGGALVPRGEPAGPIMMRGAVGAFQIKLSSLSMLLMVLLH